MTDKNETPDNVDYLAKIEHLPDVFAIPQYIIDKYSKINKKIPLQNPLPIGFIEGLLQILDEQTETALLTTRFTLAITNKNKQEAEKTLYEIGERSIEIQSRTRKLVNILMRQAIAQETGEGVSDGK